MYRCSECGQVFDVPYTWTEPYGQTFQGSPCCHDTFEEVSFCECGRMKEPYSKYCEQCEELIEPENERLRDTA